MVLWFVHSESTLWAIEGSTTTYPELGDVNVKFELWTFNLRKTVRGGISIVGFLLFSYYVPLSISWYNTIVLAPQG